MNALSRKITGVILILLGVGTMLFPFFNLGDKLSFISWFYGIPILILGIFVLFNKKKDRVGQIKSSKKR